MKITVKTKKGEIRACRMNSEEIRKILDHDNQKSGQASRGKPRKRRKRLCSGEIQTILHLEDKPNGGASETWKNTGEKTGG